MTNHAPNASSDLPLPEPPVLTNVLSAPIFPSAATKVLGCPHCKQQISVPAASDKKDPPLQWVLSKQHPLFDDLTIVRMFYVDDRGGVEVYCLTADKKMGVRQFIPNESILLCGEEMPIDVFIEELSDAEGVDDGPEEPEAPQPAVTPNGQTS